MVLKGIFQGSINHVSAATESKGGLLLGISYIVRIPSVMAQTVIDKMGHSLYCSAVIWAIWI